jgi:ferrous iron transport protein A
MDSVDLEKLSPGEHCTVATMSGLTPPARQRLQEMGITKGTRIRFVRRAPLGDPIEIRLKGYNLMLRCSEARGIFVFREKEL